MPESTSRSNAYHPRRPPEQPWPELAELRERAPVVQYDDLSVILRYRETCDAFRDPQRLSSRWRDKEDNRYSMVGTDPPDHTRIRRLCNRVLTPTRVARLEPRIRQIASDLLDGLPRGGPADLVPAFNVPLPITVLAELLGVPETDRSKFKEWSDARMSHALSDASLRGVLPEDRALDEWALEEIRRRRGRKQGLSADDGDLIDALALTRPDTDDVVEDEDLAETLVLIVVAGHETTANALGTAEVLMLSNPEIRDRLLAEPALVTTFIEECLRLEPPGIAMPRRTTCPITIGDDTIDQGKVVLLHIGSANRDPEVFPDPDKLSLDKDRPAQSLTFGLATHFCLGASLARAELRIGIQTLLERLPSLRLAQPPATQQTPYMLFRGPSDVVVTW